MKPKKQKDFVTKKRRVGKEQFRKHASSDAKLLADVSRLKKTVKLATQSISINKERLNVTSRNLTLAELVRKSRHISSSVQIHALSGIVEFCRKFDADVKLNLLTLLQIAGECLNSLNQNVRQHARTLLMELIQHLRMGSELLENNTYVQCVSAYLLKGIVASDIGVRTDIYRTVTTLVDQFPGIIALHKENILDKLVRHKPDEPAVAHIDCILALYKLDNESLKGHSVVNYLYEVLNHMLFIAGDIDSELKCLSIASLIVKTLKLLCINAQYITRDDLGFIRAFVLLNLHQFEDLTERGIQTFDALNCDYVLYRAELGLKCARVFPKHQLALMAPLCQLYNMRDAFCESHAHRVADVVLTAMAADMDTFCSQDISDLKPQWCTSMLVTFNSVDTLFTGIRKALQTNSVTVSQRILMDPDSYMPEQLPVVQIRETFRDVTRGLVDSISDKPEVLPVIAVASGVSPSVLQEFYSTVPGMSQVVDIMSKLGPDFRIVDNMDIDTVSILSSLLNMDKTMSLRSQVLFTVVQVSMIPNTVPVDTFMDRYCTAKCIATLNREDLCLVTRALLNFPASKDIGSRIMDLLKQWLCNVRLWERCYTTELIAPMVYHMFCEGPECVIGIDDRLVSLNSLLEVLCEIAEDLDKMLTVDVLDTLEYVLGSFVSRTIEHLIRSQSNNIWSIEDAREVVFKRCVSTAIEKMVSSSAYNMGVCVLNTALIHAVCQYSDIQVNSQEFRSHDNVKMPQWLHKLEQHNATEALINRLPMDKNLQNPIQKLCLAAGQLLM